MSLFLLFKVSGLVAIKAPPAIVRGLFTKLIPRVATFLYLNTWDSVLFLLNVCMSRRPVGSVVKPGIPGHKGEWPKWVAPGEGDSRAPCPYLNALANHGVLPHDGKNIDLNDLGKVMCNTLNFSPTLVRDTVNTVVDIYGRDRIDLGDLSAHNVVEHDASLVRTYHRRPSRCIVGAALIERGVCYVSATGEDAYFAADQTKPSEALIKRLLASASGPATSEHPGGYLTPADLSRFLALREAQSKRDNPVFSLDIPHRFFGASNASLLYETVAGDVELCRTILLEERFPDGFETKLRQRFGYTMVEFHLRSAEIFLLKKPVKPN